MKELKYLVRPNIQALEPYSSARDEYSGGQAHVFLDANECPYNAPYNRYPDPTQAELKEALAQVKGIKPECIFLGNGSDEAIDLVYRVFCIPGRDNVAALSPTYGMYGVCAAVNDVEYRTLTLDSHFDFEADRLLDLCDNRTKAIFLCSPNNPTGNSLNRDEIHKVLERFEGMVVIDEAYGEFSTAPSFRFELPRYHNLIVLNTLSKAWGSAGIRLGMAFAIPAVIGYFNKVKYPYNIGRPTMECALEMVKRRYDVDKWVFRLLEERARVVAAFRLLPSCKEVFPTDANFFLARMENATAIYKYLIGKGIIVRNRSNVELCEDCLRVTIGTPQENSALLGALRQYV